jgi:hypothetical protein
LWECATVLGPIVFGQHATTWDEGIATLNTPDKWAFNRLRMLGCRRHIRTVREYKILADDGQSFPKLTNICSLAS